MWAGMEIMSTGMIKPKFPTPHHIRNYKLSLLDQLAPSHYFPLIFFYQSDSGCKLDHAQICQQLKGSLSDVLTRFYPLAGKFNGGLSVDCNDAGALYIEAKVHAYLSEEMKRGSIEDLNRFLPFNPHGRGSDTGRDILLAIQINFFDCGGIAIGVCMSHKIADGSSLVMFMSAWAAMCRGDAEILEPNFELASRHFPPKDLPDFGTKSHSGNTKEKFVAKRFVFDKQKLATLKEVIRSFSVNDPTRVEAVTAFLWKRFMEVAKVRNGKETFAALHALNLRPRTNAPLPEHAFGNIWRFLIALSTYESHREYHDLVVQFRNAITKIKNENDSDYLKSLGLFSTGEIEICTFSSWCRFPVYEVDFGWGKPLLVCTAAIPFKNAVILMNTRSGDGIEAWVNMLADDFEILQNDQELVSLLVPGMV